MNFPEDYILASRPKGCCTSNFYTRYNYP